MNFRNFLVRKIEMKQTAKKKKSQSQIICQTWILLDNTELLNSHTAKYLQM